MKEFRTLTADEIECRVSQIKKNGLSLLLYKDARVDQNILDETVGAMNWQKHYSRDNANCVVSIWDDDKKQWIEKEDTGTESNTEKEKGLASDSFKRACFNWGIGRELYTAPFIWIGSEDCNISMDDGKAKCYDKFSVRDISYDEKHRIVGLTIVNNSRSGAEVFRLGGQQNKSAEKQVKAEAKKETPAEAPTTNAAIEEAQLKARVIGYVNNNKFTQEQIASLCKRYQVSALTELGADACRHYIAFIENHGGKI